MAFPRLIPSLLSALVLLMVATPSTSAYNVAFNVYGNTTTCSGSPAFQKVYDSSVVACANALGTTSIGLSVSVQCQSNSASSAYNVTVYSSTDCSSSGSVNAGATGIFSHTGNGRTCYAFSASGNTEAASASAGAFAGLTYEVDCSGQVSAAATAGTSIMGVAALAVTTVLALVVA